MLIQGYTLSDDEPAHTQVKLKRQLKCCENFGFHFHFIPDITLAFMRLVSFDVRWFS